uniref:hypothetical protein n=1 Tax=Kitasatospora sp. NBC_01519 TaxID=2903576 RepID=UPI002F906ED5
MHWEAEALDRDLLHDLLMATVEPYVYRDVLAEVLAGRPPPTRPAARVPEPVVSYSRSGPLPVRSRLPGAVTVGGCLWLAFCPGLLVGETTSPWCAAPVPPSDPYTSGETFEELAGVEAVEQARGPSTGAG